MKTLAAGDEGAFRRLAEVSRFSPRNNLFAPPVSPLLTGDLDVYAPLWAQALGRRDLPRFHDEIASLFRSSALSSLTPIGAPAALTRRLGSEGDRLGIVSNDFESSICLQAGMLQILDDLDFIAGRDSGFGTTPDPGMIVAFAGAFGISPGLIAVAGDTLADLRAAHAAGAVPIGVLTGPALREDSLGPAPSLVRSPSCRTCWQACSIARVGTQPAAQRRTRRAPPVCSRTRSRVVTSKRSSAASSVGGRRPSVCATKVR